MGMVVKAAAFIVVGTTLMYVIVFLLVLPVMSKAPAAPHTVAKSLYANLYIPVRDALPAENAIRVVIQDYEAYWCAGSPKCEL